MRSLTIRREEPPDSEAIRYVIYEAFKGLPYAQGDEHKIVGALRLAGALAVSLVAELDGRVVGHIAFSPAEALDESVGWYALGPVSVLPPCQGSGVGSALIHRGLEEIESLGAVGCILTGDPNYYARFGFEAAPALAPPGEPAEYFMVRITGAENPKGHIYFHEAFRGAV